MNMLKRCVRRFMYLGPLVGRFGQAKVSLPGGCAWGPRPVNMHIEGIKKLGADIELEAGYIVAKAKRLHGARILFDISSVGATGNVFMAAVLAKGTTLIENAAQEPEIVQLTEYLIMMGAKIHGAGSGRLEIEGVDELHPADITTIPDRIEAGTFLIAAMLAGKKDRSIRIQKCEPHHIGSLIVKLEDAGGIDNDRAGLGGTCSAERNPSDQYHDCDLSRLSDRYAGAMDYIDVARQRNEYDNGYDLFRSIYACSGAVPPWCKYHHERKYSHRCRRPEIGRGESYVHRFARERFAHSRGTRCRGNYRSAPRVPYRPGIRSRSKRNFRRSVRTYAGKKEKSFNRPLILSRMINDIIRTRVFSGAAAAFTLTAVVCSCIPLFNSLGFEFSAALAIAGGFIAGIFTLGAWRAGQCETLRDVRAFLGSAAALLFLLSLLPLLIAFGSAFFVRNCSIAAGLEYYFLLAVPSFFFCGALAFLVAVVSSRFQKTIFTVSRSADSGADTVCYVDAPSNIRF